MITRSIPTTDSTGEFGESSTPSSAYLSPTQSGLCGIEHSIAQADARGVQRGLALIHLAMASFRRACWAVLLSQRRRAPMSRKSPCRGGTGRGRAPVSPTSACPLISAIEASANLQVRLRFENRLLVFGVVDACDHFTAFHRIADPLGDLDDSPETFGAMIYWYRGYTVPVNSRISGSAHIGRGRPEPPQGASPAVSSRFPICRS